MSFSASANTLSPLQSLAAVSSQLGHFKQTTSDGVAPLRLSTPLPMKSPSVLLKEATANDRYPGVQTALPDTASAVAAAHTPTKSDTNLTSFSAMPAPAQESKAAIPDARTQAADPQNPFHTRPGSTPQPQYHTVPSPSDTLPVPRQLRLSQQQHHQQQQHQRQQQQQTIEVGKRTKSSRACDECRRKKIRCDIDSGAVSCSPCQRLGTCCTFSRVQLKRGPTKRARSYSDSTQPYPQTGQLPGIDALLSWSTQLAGGAGVHSSGVVAGGRFNALPERRQSFAGGFASLFDGSRSPAVGTLAPGLQPNSPTAQPDSPRVAMNSSSLQYYNQVSSPNAQPPSPRLSNNPSSPLPPIAARSNSGSSPMSLNGSSGSLSAAPGYSVPMVDPIALAHYHAKWHPIFPILPDTPRELEHLIAQAGPSGTLLAAAITGNIRSIPSDPMISGASRVAQLMALLLLYLHTLEFAWLGAAVAMVIAVSRDNNEHGQRLLGVVAALDQLDSAVFGNPRLLTAPVEKPTDPRLLRTFWGIGADVSVPNPPHDSALLALQWLARPTAAEARAELQKLAPALVDTPLHRFVQAVLEGRRRR